MSTDNALDALTARMLEAVKNTRESADSAAASAQQAQKMAEGEMQGTSLTGAEKKLLVQILQRAANKNSEMQPAVDELKSSGRRAPDDRTQYLPRLDGFGADIGL